MSTVGIAIDKWKLQIFSRHLVQAGYTFTTWPGLDDDTWLLKVRAHLIAPLSLVVEAAERECGH